MRFSLVGIFLLAVVYALYFAREFFMPVVLAFLLALTLTPVVRVLRKHGMPAYFSATFWCVLSGLGIAAAGYMLSGPVVELMAKQPSIGRAGNRTALRFPPAARTHRSDLAADRAPDRVVEETGRPEGGLSQARHPVAGGRQPRLRSATSIAITFVLSLFLLASGTLFYEKIVQSFASLTEKKRALRIVYDVEREISRYLLPSH